MLACIYILTRRRIDITISWSTGLETMVQRAECIFNNIINTVWQAVPFYAKPTMHRVHPRTDVGVLWAAFGGRSQWQKQFSTIRSTNRLKVASHLLLVRQTHPNRLQAGRQAGRQQTSERMGHRMRCSREILIYLLVWCECLCVEVVLPYVVRF